MCKTVEVDTKEGGELLYVLSYTYRWSFSLLRALPDELSKEASSIDITHIIPKHMVKL